MILYEAIVIIIVYNKALVKMTQAGNFHSICLNGKSLKKC